MEGRVVIRIPAALGAALPYGRVYVDGHADAAAAEESIMAPL
jgi:hypothetical protein